MSSHKDKSVLIQTGGHKGSSHVLLLAFGVLFLYSPYLLVPFVYEHLSPSPSLQGLGRYLFWLRNHHLIPICSLLIWQLASCYRFVSVLEACFFLSLLHNERGKIPTTGAPSEIFIIHHLKYCLKTAQDEHRYHWNVTDCY